jgi:hypothetical protein
MKLNDLFLNLFKHIYRQTGSFFNFLKDIIP